ncbi:YdcH family protein [Caenispirillum bisanense]|uniref:YdcH family protein n=1 Tax=Caenispirillum bisanense TaxID=414052 RepID=UPI0031E3A2E1
MIDDETERLRLRLTELKQEHRDLDDVIARLLERAPFDQLQMQRLKKKKLSLKDEISYVESKLHPDIIA